MKTYGELYEEMIKTLNPSFPRLAVVIHNTVNNEDEYAFAKQVAEAYADQQVKQIVDKIEHEMELEEKAASSPPSVHPTQHYITLKWVLNCIDKIKQP